MAKFENKWHRGPPPSIGWWPASYTQSPNLFRWWNGRYWSECVIAGASMNLVSKQANLKEGDSERIEWAHRPDDWPARSRT